MAMTSLIKESIKVGFVYSFEHLVHYCYGEKHDSTQADMVLQNNLRVFCLDLRPAKRDRDTETGLSF